MKDFNSQEDFINGLTENIKTNRSSLVGEKFNIISMMGEVKYEVEVNKLIGEGASALVYEVSVDDTYPPIKKMIMKEFYPNYNEDNIVAERNPINRLELYFDAITSKDEQRIKKDRNKFIDAYNKHIRILEMDSFFDSKIVRPYRVEIDNSFLYSLYEVDSATSVDKYYNLDLARIVDILIQTADILIHLHNNDIIYMDLKPANILYDYNNSRVKLFDFDAAIDLNELDQINEFAMPSDKTFIPPEIRFISDISKRKEIFITEEIDLYMLAATFFTLLMARTPTVKENEDMDLLERNLREVLNHKSNKILINQKSEDEIVSLLQDTLSI
ncbi:MAG: protein kinase, partial [Anaerococcus sp.]|nr:protein kinase [Anaerococcus sp.]